jgi:hypothetical protein
VALEAVQLDEDLPRDDRRSAQRIVLRPRPEQRGNGLQRGQAALGQQHVGVHHQKQLASPRGGRLGLQQQHA